MLAWGLGHVCAIAVGISLGLIGGGGAILAVPILVYVLGVGPKSAIAISLVSVGTVSAMGTVLHWRAGRVRLDIALLFAPAAMLGAYLGALIASFSWISETFQLLCFGMIMLFVSLLLIRKSRAKSSSVQSERAQVNKAKNQPILSVSSSKSTANSIASRPLCQSSWRHQMMIPIEGLGIGVLTGFVGIGGGFAIVPALVLLTGIPMKQAVGTSLLIISLKSVTGFLGYVNQLNID
ncbi:MAG: sulfite exporter TauE/SafE family protein, partial [Cyanobacteria bacterium J06632_3]